MGTNVKLCTSHKSPFSKTRLIAQRQAKDPGSYIKPQKRGLLKQHQDWKGWCGSTCYCAGWGWPIFWAVEFWATHCVSTESGINMMNPRERENQPRLEKRRRSIDSSVATTLSALGRLKKWFFLSTDCRVSGAVGVSKKSLENHRRRVREESTAPTVEGGYSSSFGRW